MFKMAGLSVVLETQKAEIERNCQDSLYEQWLKLLLYKYSRYYIGGLHLIHTGARRVQTLGSAL